MARKKKKGRIRWDRIFIVLFIIIFIVSLIKFINYTVYNNKVYNNVVNSSAKDASIRKKYKKLKIYNKTMDLIKSDNVSVVIDDKKIDTYIESNNVKKNMDLKTKLYSKKIKYENFPNVKSYFIDNTGIVKKSTKIVVKLPKYLSKNNIVDVYGVTKDNKVESLSLANKVKDDVEITTNEKYEKYFITYIKLEKMTVGNLSLNKGAVVNLNVKYEPECATIKDYEYSKIGDIFTMSKDKKIIANKAGTGSITIKHTKQNITATSKITVKAEENKIEEKNGITYVNGILVVNKTYSLPQNYNPGKLNDEVLSAYNEMRQAADKDNITLWIASGYRSYSTQQELYNNYVKKDGKEKAEKYSARPGHSEHQSGLAMDLNIVDDSFIGTKEAIWIEKNCYKYGFIIRYPKGKDDVTGYKYEPWHIRYLGKDLAKKVYNSGLTLEEYLGIESKYKD